MNRICCIFINHRKKEYKDVFNKMSTSVDYIDFYDYNPDWNKIIELFKGMIFIEDIHDIIDIYSSNCIFAVLYFKLFHNDYDYYFVCENDTLFTGNYKLLFDELTKNLYDYDAVIQNELWYPPKDWLWTSKEKYYNLIDGYSKETCRNLLYKFYCFSNEMCDYIFNGYINGYYGHQDLCISCMLEQFGGKYDYLINHFDIKISPDESDITKKDIKSPNKLLHPVKK